MPRSANAVGGDLEQPVAVAAGVRPLRPRHHRSASFSMPAKIRRQMPLTKRRVPPVCFPEAASAYGTERKPPHRIRRKQIGNHMTTATVTRIGRPDAAGRSRPPLAGPRRHRRRPAHDHPRRLDREHRAPARAGRRCTSATPSRQWALTAYTLTFGGLLLLGGRIADYFGRKRTFLDRPVRLRRRLRARRCAHSPPAGCSAPARCKACSPRCSRPPCSRSSPRPSPRRTSAPRRSPSTAPSPAPAPPSV